MLDWLNPDYIRQMVEIDKRMMNDISELLKLEYPDKIGLSLRILKEFCKRHNIHKHMPLSSEELNYHVATAVCEVGGTYGRKMMRGHLEHAHGINVGEQRVRESLRLVNPFYHFNRQRGAQNQVNPSSYHPPYFGYNLHLDQNEKLEMFGVVYVAAIDGMSAFVTSCTVMPRKNNVAIYREVFKKTLSIYGLFEQIIVDQGKEFFLTLFMQHYYSTFCSCNHAPYKQVPSTKNNRIERWWGELNKPVNYPIKYCLIDLEREDRPFSLDRSISHHEFSVSTVVSAVAAYGSQIAVNAWNSHTIPGKGKPKDHVSNSKATVVPEVELLSDDEVVAKYEADGGSSTRETSYRQDLLKFHEEAARHGDEEFINNILPTIGDISYIFGSVSNHCYEPLQTGIVEHIRISECYFQNLQ